MNKNNMVKRRKEIVELLAQNRSLKVTDLVDRFGVSAVTIRNDLIYLENNMLCKRSFGKVMSYDRAKTPALQKAEMPAQLIYKEVIGKYAASLIQPGDSVFFYAGSTVEQVVKYLNPKTEFIALTNSIFIANELRSFTKVHPILLGGLLSRNMGFTYGDEAIRQLKGYNVDKLFLSVDGIDARTGITNASPFEGDINRAVISCANQVVIVADHTKVGNSSFVRMGSAEDVDILITDPEADNGAVEQLKKTGVDVRIIGAETLER